MRTIIPNWPAPENVLTVSTTRFGGVSAAPYSALNVGLHVGDDVSAVLTNRQLLKDHCWLTTEPAWLNQVHSPIVIDLTAPLTDVIDADGSFTRVPGLACAIMTADCLPILLCNKQGTEVAAVHAGWRGLAAGVIDNAIAKFTCSAADIMVWMGPAIGPMAFEVGNDVRDQFIAVDTNATEAFVAHGDKWLANLYLLARQRLQQHGINAIYGGDHCTFSDDELFYSYRRQAVTGRQASLIWLR